MVTARRRISIGLRTRSLDGVEEIACRQALYQYMIYSWILGLLFFSLVTRFFPCVPTSFGKYRHCYLPSSDLSLYFHFLPFISIEPPGSSPRSTLDSFSTDSLPEPKKVCISRSEHNHMTNPPWTPTPLHPIRKVDIQVSTSDNFPPPHPRASSIRSRAFLRLNYAGTFLFLHLPTNSSA